MNVRTRGLSPKVLGPVATALSAFAVAKIGDVATEGLVVALIGAAVAYLLPPGDVAVDVETDQPAIEDVDGAQADLDTVTEKWHEGATTRPDPPTEDVAT